MYTCIHVYKYIASRSISYSQIQVALLTCVYILSSYSRVIYIYSQISRLMNCVLIYTHVTPWHFVAHISISLSFLSVASSLINTIQSHSLPFFVTSVYLSTHTNNTSKVEADGLLVVVPVGFQRQTSVLGHGQMVGPVCVCVSVWERRECARCQHQ